MKLPLDIPETSAIINPALATASAVLAGLCKGSTADSDSVCEGSNPSPAAMKSTTLHVLWIFFFLDSNPHNGIRAVLPKAGARAEYKSRVQRTAQPFESFSRCLVVAKSALLVFYACVRRTQKGHTQQGVPFRCFVTWCRRYGRRHRPDRARCSRAR